MSIKAIVAVDNKWKIGYKNQLLYSIPEDLKRFKELTEHQYVVMGRNTFDSILKINGKPLPNRFNVVLTRNKKYETPLGVFKLDSVKKIIQDYRNSGTQAKDMYIIGGQQVFEQFLPHIEEVLVTYIDDTAPKADTYFPRELLEEGFYLAESEKHYSEKYDCDYYYVTYKRK